MYRVEGEQESQYRPFPRVKHLKIDEYRDFSR